MHKGATQAFDRKLSNVAFVRTRIEFINAFFEAGEVDEIWLTFPDPQMKKVTKRLSSTVITSYSIHYTKLYDLSEFVRLEITCALVYVVFAVQLNNVNYK